MSKQQELNNCTPIKAILMLLVVLYHSMAIYVGGDTPWGPFQPAEEAYGFEIVAKWLNSFHVYAFTLISGYIFYYIRHEKDGYRNYVPFLANKAKRLLVPYVFISAIWVVPVYIYFYGTGKVIRNFVLGCAPNQLWFLLMLFWVFAIFWLISDLVNHKPVLGGVIVCGLYFVGMIVPNYFCLSTGLQYIMFFYIGFLTRKLELGNKIFYRIPTLVYIIVDILLFISVEFLSTQGGMTLKVLWLGLSIVLHAFGAIAAFTLLQRLMSCGLGANRIVSFLAKNSMVIYLVHQQLIYFSIGWANGVFPPTVLVLINFVFSISVSITFSTLMSRTKMTRFLVGS